MPHELKTRVFMQVIDVSLRSGKQIVYTQHLMAAIKQSINEM